MNTPDVYPESGRSRRLREKERREQAIFNVVVAITVGLILIGFVWHFFF